MQRSKWLRAIAAFAAISMLAAACGGDDDPTADTGGDTTTDTGGDTDGDTADTDGDTTDGDTTGDTAAPTGRGDGTLTLGRVLPESGFLDYLGQSMIAGVQLAVEDINAAGGVLDGDVSLLEEDSGTDPTVAVPNVNSLLASGADAIIGAAASGVTGEFVAALRQNGVVNCSPSATSPAFVTNAEAEFMFRTVPPDNAVAPIIADEIVTQDGNTSVVIVNRSDDYGTGLAELVAQELEALNAEVLETVSYTDEEQTFDAQVNAVTSNEPDAVVLIAFREGATFLNGLAEAGFDMSGVYGADGVFSGQLPEFTAGEGGDLSVLEGMKVIGASGGQEFNQKLNEFLPDRAKGEFIYGGQAYDCAIVLALAAHAAGTDDSSQFASEIIGITTGGEKCTSFEQCKTMLDEGTDIDYDGVSGNLELEGTDGGNLANPTTSTYAVAQFNAEGSLDPVRSTQVDL